MREFLGVKEIPPTRSALLFGNDFYVAVQNPPKDSTENWSVFRYNRTETIHRSFDFPFGVQNQTQIINPDLLSHVKKEEISTEVR